MKYKVKYSKAFKKGLKKLKNDAKSLNLVKVIIEKLANDENLEPSLNDHKLTGEYQAFRECHIKSDLLLIYKKESQILTLFCLVLGSHSEVFGK